MPDSKTRSTAAASFARSSSLKPQQATVQTQLTTVFRAGLRLLSQPPIVASHMAPDSTVESKKLTG